MLRDRSPETGSVVTSVETFDRRSPKDTSPGDITAGDPPDTKETRVAFGLGPFTQNELLIC